jgi:hypothetical protein
MPAFYSYSYKAVNTDLGFRCMLLVLVDHW